MCCIFERYRKIMSLFFCELTTGCFAKMFSEAVVKPSAFSECPAVIVNLIQ